MRARIDFPKIAACRRWSCNGLAVDCDESGNGYFRAMLVKEVKVGNLN